MPTSQIAQVVRWLELRPGTEVDSDQPSNVGNRKVRTKDEFVVGKLLVQPGEKMLDSRTAAFGQRGDLLVGLRSRLGVPF